jgi:hypothetical protein
VTAGNPEWRTLRIESGASSHAGASTTGGFPRVLRLSGVM